MGSELKKYTVEINGYETVLQLSDADAEARGLVSKKPAPVKKAAPRAANKARTAANK